MGFFKDTYKKAIHRRMKILMIFFAVCFQGKSVVISFTYYYHGLNDHSKFRHVVSYNKLNTCYTVPLLDKGNYLNLNLFEIVYKFEVCSTQY